MMPLRLNIYPNSQSITHESKVLNQYRNLRYNSNPREEKSRESSNHLTRFPLSQISRPHYTQNIPNHPSSITKSAYQKFREGAKKHFSHEKNDKSKTNDSLMIESLCAVPKNKRLNPIREKLIRLFNCSKQRNKSSCNKSILTYENLVFIEKELDETPSPMIKPRYINKN